MPPKRPTDAILNYPKSLLDHATSHVPRYDPVTGVTNGYQWAEIQQTSTPFINPYHIRLTQNLQSQALFFMD
jgi:hypothetical protein